MDGKKMLTWLPSSASLSGLALPVDNGANTLGDLGSFLSEKLKEEGRKMLTWLPSSASLSGLALPVDTGANTLGDVGSFLSEKLKELLHWLESLPGFIQEKIDQILPPETRSATLHHYLAFALRVVLPVALSLLCLYYCCKCCCCSSRRGPAKMMKAPGRMGKMIPRASFKADPRGYFIDLRASPELR